MKFSSRFPTHRGVFALAASLVLAACGGGGADGTGSPVASSAFSSGVMTKGSVIVNGVRYDDTNAQVIDDRGRSVSQLGNGMRIKLVGRIGSDGVSGTAERVKVDAELRGTVASVDLGATPPSFVVGTVTVRTDEATVYSDGAVLATLAGNRVEVHGLRDATGAIRATRVERLVGNAVADSLRGPITAVNSATSFTIGSGPSSAQVTVAGGATYQPASCGAASIVVGRVIEVQGSFPASGPFSATLVRCEDLYDDDRGIRPQNGARSEVEGYVSGLDLANTRFSIGGITVVWSATTQFRNGSLADLSNGARVEAEGTLNGSTLTAREVSFKRPRVIVQGAVTAVSTDPAARSLTVLGIVVRIDDLTEREVNVQVGARVKVRAYTDSLGRLVAEEIRSGDSEEILQAPVTAETGSSITLAGVTVSLPSNARYQAVDDGPLVTRDAFLSAVGVGTLVKVKGTPLSAGVSEAEIEQ